MKIFNILFLSIIFSFISLAAKAVDLVYKWKAGTVYRFHTLETDEVSMNISMGMNTAHTDIYKTDMIFALKVNSVQANGTADALLYVEQFKVTNSAGKVMASLAGIPKEALSSPVEVDQKGNFTYKKIVYMIMQDNATMVVTGKAEQNKVSTSATYPDGTQLSVNAEFDPKTGTLKGGYTASTVGKAHEKRVQIKEDAKQIDLLPYDFLELLKLPEGDIQAGQTIAVKAAGMDMTVKAESIVAGVATINCNFKQDMSKMCDNNNVVIQDDSGQNMNMNQDMNGNMNMDMNMGGVNTNPGNDMGMPAQDKAMMPESSSDGKIVSTFDSTKGMFRTLTGTINSSTKSMGMNMSIKSSLVLKALN
ncbi:MAG: hypothetical protein ACJ75J_06605 [Cytophagaceae bacterium]